MTPGVVEPSCPASGARLLAVDIGLRTGLATYRPDGRLESYRSKNLGSSEKLKRTAHEVLSRSPRWLVLEGGGHLAALWEKEALRCEVDVLRLSAETWRGALLYPRQQRDARLAKRSAEALARRVIEWSRAPRPTSLRHDAAEAILVGLWGVLRVGWLERLPPELAGGRSGQFNVVPRTE